MTEPKWTLGPWVFQPIADRHRGWIKSVCKGWPERIVARPEGQETAGEREANARLIAAAPELYEALAALCIELNNHLALESLVGVDLVREGIRALAKAVGEDVP